MTYIVYLMLLLSSEPGPTYMVIESYSTLSACQDAAKTFITKSGLKPEQAARLACTPVITSPLSEPL
jgi:hypothetical protein